MLNEVAAFLGAAAGSNADPASLAVYVLLGLLLRRWIFVVIATAIAALVVTAIYRAQIASMVPPGWPEPRPFADVAAARATGALLVASATYLVARAVRRRRARHAAREAQR